jgi:hypothetical protein
MHLMKHSLVTRSIYVSALLPAFVDTCSLLVHALEMLVVVMID